MTEQEALALKPGDRVEMRAVRSNWRVATVVEVVVWDQAQLDAAIRRPSHALGNAVGTVRHVAVRSSSTNDRTSYAPMPPNSTPSRATSSPIGFGRMDSRKHLKHCGRDFRLPMGYNGVQVRSGCVV